MVRVRAGPDIQEHAGAADPIHVRDDRMIMRRPSTPAELDRAQPTDAEP